MKRILITGKNSYIGQTFINWVKANNVDYKIDTIDLKDPDWKKRDFSIYDCLIHLAAIVHKKGQEDDGFTSIFWTHFSRVFFRNESTLENVIVSA
ncbi:hypothetical protein TH5N_09230 [Tetragenococcus halophilus]|uniref:hypothetical protein n=1 Tax=Tetragenococcus halophilus TaxID=51669 RepID=UPI001928D64E|nr:hypothetical protein [Tetragenococcus halophilus]GEQ37756.1 hypothetical protein TH3N_08820 [Tetragenococcus halophilus]GEQ40045.1 hypothetical protein TH5N_09230 [Tetragenococcus halophilus]GEQ42133.1 hypothetical protein TH6N_07590 [Tetragenococcus halophilus]GEQ44466.1 hypothetical protein TH8N_08360 [Tetragenococcus halophilus]GEQ46810.1 hypothetical protein TH9N_09230 [Tetragenococcus halophilus]